MSPEFWAGYVSGVASILAGNPLDLIKVRLQAGTAPTGRIGGPRPQQRATSSGTARASAALGVLRNAPVRDWLRGLPAPVLTYGGLNAVLFSSYTQAVRLLAAQFPESMQTSSEQRAAMDTSGGTPANEVILSSDAATVRAAAPVWMHFAGGAYAGLATFWISTPTELIKCRAQVEQSHGQSRGHPLQPEHAPVHVKSATPPSSSSWAIAQRLWIQHGIRGFFHGGAVTSARDSLGYAFYFCSYEASSRAWTRAARRTHKRVSSSSPGVWGQRVLNSTAAQTLLCGGFAGVATWLSVYPLDVVKSRVQTESSLLSPATSTSTTAVRASTLSYRWKAFSMARQMYAAGGPRVFMAGLGVCCVRAFGVNAVQWSVYEWCLRALGSAATTENK